MEIITCHIYADLDALSSMVLIKKLYPNGVLVFPGHIGKSVKAFVNLYQNFLQVKKIKDIQSEIQRLLVLEYLYSKVVRRPSTILTLQKRKKKDSKS